MRRPDFEIDRSAKLSDCGLYRYYLWRNWDIALASMTFVMLNPSTADGTQDDATIRRCMTFARREGLGGIHVVNLFAFRATKPVDLTKANAPIGPDNAAHLEGRLRAAQAGMTRIVCAWGAHPFAIDQASEFRRLARMAGVPLYCLGKTKDGQPRHPLYLPDAQPLEVWE